MATLAIPGRAMPRQMPVHVARCQACGDFGTIVFSGERRPATMPEILENEAPCTCQSGDLWRQIFEQWDQPMTPAGRLLKTLGGKP